MSSCYAKAVALFIIILFASSVFASINIIVKASSDISYSGTSSYSFSNSYYRFNIAQISEKWYLNLTDLAGSHIVLQNSLMFNVLTNANGTMGWISGGGLLTETVTSIANNLGTGILFNFTVTNENCSTMSCLISVFNDEPFFVIQEAKYCSSAVVVSQWDYFLAQSTVQNGGFLIGSSVSSMYSYPSLNASNPSFFTKLGGSTSGVVDGYPQFNYGEYIPYEYTSSTVNNEGFVAGLLQTQVSPHLCYCWKGVGGCYGLQEFGIGEMVQTQVLTMTSKGRPYTDAYQQGTPGSWIQSDPLYCELTGNNAQIALKGYDTTLSKTNNYSTSLETLTASSFGWGSWAAFGQSVTQQEIIANSNYADANYSNIKLIQLDDGWQQQYGDWVPNSNFPSDPSHPAINGIQYLANIVHANGQKFGLWFCPYYVAENLPITKENPSWILHSASSAPETVSFNGVVCYILDPTNPEVINYISQIVENFTSWGVNYLKIDTMGGDVYEAVESTYNVLNTPMTATQAMQLGLNAIKAAAPYANTLLCGLHFVATTTAQSIRTGGDVNNSWSEIQNSANAALELLPILGNDTVLLDNDYVADQMIPTASVMDDSTFQTWLNLEYSVGSVQILSVNLPTYNTTRLQWINALENPASTGIKPQILDLSPSQTGTPEIWYQNKTHFLALFNWNTTKSQSFKVTLSSLGLNPADKYNFTDPFTGAQTAVSGSFSIIVEPESSMSYFITQNSASTSIVPLILIQIIVTLVAAMVIVAVAVGVFLLRKRAFKTFPRKSNHLTSKHF